MLPKLVLAGTPHFLDAFLTCCQAACRSRFGAEEGKRRFLTLTLLDALALFSR